MSNYSKESSESAIRNGNEPVLASKENKDTRKSKSDEVRNAKIIFDFLDCCSQYEADALRVLVAATKENAAFGLNSTEDRYSINRFLNYGMNNGVADVDLIRGHRNMKAHKLMESIGRYVNKEALIKVSGIVFPLANDKESIDYAVKTFSANSSKSKVTSKPTQVTNDPTLDFNQ